MLRGFGMISHSAVGAVWAERLLSERFGAEGRMMARALQCAIAGHHAGLEDWDDGLATRLASEDADRECDEALGVAGLPPSVLRPARLPDSLRSLRLGDERKDISGRFALWQRTLFSAPVDADFLGTERATFTGRAWIETVDRRSEHRPSFSDDPARNLAGRCGRRSAEGSSGAGGLDRRRSGAAKWGACRACARRFHASRVHRSTMWVDVGVRVLVLRLHARVVDGFEGPC